ncbi:MAG: hypothetical protein LBV41_00650 [Cytophagaceae bacterium]|jgi:hypothetical protein|nr:hypothetical protein [Cytophagaceae bacterium]
MHQTVTVIAFILFVTPLFAQESIEIAKDYTLVVDESFRSEKLLNRLEKFSSGQWLTAKHGKPGKCLKYIANDKTREADIRPVAKAVVKENMFTGFILELDVEQCGRDYDCRDFCLIFNFADEENYAFAHFASVAGEMCHGIFTVQSGKLEQISDETSEAVLWGMDEWHKIRMEAETGKVRVWFDGKLLWNVDMPAESQGCIGFGAADGAAKIDNLKIWIR